MAEEIEEKIEEWIDNILTSPRNLASQVELRQQAKMALRYFKEADTDQSNLLDVNELKTLCDELHLPIESSEEEDTLIKLDKDENGGVDIEEWIQWWLNRISSLPNPLKQQEAIARNVFAQIDADKSGFLDASELKELIDQLGVSFTDEEIIEAMAEIDSDDSGVIECNEFIAWWTNKLAGQRNSVSIIDLKLKRLAAAASRVFNTDIFTAAWKGDVGLVSSFLQSEKRLANSTDESEYGEGWSPLQYACYQGHTEVVNALIDAGANVNLANNLGFSSLFYAAQRGHVEICKLLMDRGADPTLFGTHPEIDQWFLSAADFITDYPSLNPLFEEHNKCKPPITLAFPENFQRCYLNNTGILNIELKFSGGKLPVGLPIHTWRAILTVENVIKFDEKELSIDIPGVNPSKDQIMKVEAPKSWLNSLYLVYFQEKLANLSLPDNDVMGFCALWRVFNQYYITMEQLQIKVPGKISNNFSNLLNKIADEGSLGMITAFQEKMTQHMESSLKAAKEKENIKSNTDTLENLEKVVLAFIVDYEEQQKPSKKGTKRSTTRIFTQEEETNMSKLQHSIDKTAESKSQLPKVSIKVAAINALFVGAFSNVFPIFVSYPK